MIHIALLIPTLDQIGGAERQVLLLAQELAARDRQVTIVALSGTGAGVIGQLQAANVGFLTLEMRRAWVDPRGWLRYLRWARQHPPDILHAHLPHATWFARTIRLLAPSRVVIDTRHTSRPAGRGKRIVYRATEWLSNHSTCVSQSVANAAIASRIARQDHFTVLPNGVLLPDLSNCFPGSSVQPFHPDRSEGSDSGNGAVEQSCPEHTRPFASSQFNWVAVGRLSPVKDYPTLIRALAVLPANSGQIAQLTIVGTGPEEQSLQHLSRALGVESRVHFGGFQKEVGPSLRDADGFVQASLYEGLPISILEAQAAMLPIVATDAPGMREAMIAGKSGILTPIRDFRALARAMAEIMNMQAYCRRQMGACGRQFVQENFEISIVVDRWQGLYAWLLDRHPWPSRWGSKPLAAKPVDPQPGQHGGMKNPVS